MSIEPPSFKICNPDNWSCSQAGVTYLSDANGVVDCLQKELSARTDWKRSEGGAGTALTQLFGRLVELTFNRLNQTPENHFVAFLNAAGIDRLPPRAARVDLTFTPKVDAPGGRVRVPAGTQLATVKTEAQAEVIFETARDLVVAPNQLERCMVIDPLRIADRTARVTGASEGAFAAFEGVYERERVLYLGQSELFAFADDAERQGTTIELDVKLIAMDPAMTPWLLRWQYYDEAEAGWVDLSPDSYTDTTVGFSQSGTITFENLPFLGETVVSDGVNEWKSRWLRVCLSGLSAAQALPVVDTIDVTKHVKIDTDNQRPDACFYHIPHSGVYQPLDCGGEFYPLGARPTRHDTFYIAADGALSKPGAVITLQFDIASFDFPDNCTANDIFKDIEIVWSYFDGAQWQELGSSNATSTIKSTVDTFQDNTSAFTAEGSKSVTFTVPDGRNYQTPKPFKVNGEAHYWLQVRLVKGFYGTEGSWGDSQWKPEVLYPPLIKSVSLGYTACQESRSSALTACIGKVDLNYTDHSTACKTPALTFEPFTAREEGPALYLGFQNSFPADEWIQLLVDIEPVITEGKAPPVFWEYWNGNWCSLKTSDGTGGLQQRGYVGFFAPRDHCQRDEFGHTAYWLRLLPYREPVADAGATQAAVFTRDEQTEVTLDAGASRAFAGQRIVRYSWQLKPKADPYIKGAAPGAVAVKRLVVTTDTEEMDFELDAGRSVAPPVKTIENHVWRRRSYHTEPLPIADAGQDQFIRTQDETVDVRVDASASLTLNDKLPIEKYTWSAKTVDSEKNAKGITVSPWLNSPWLNTIRLNTVPAFNAETIRDEVLGSGNDKPGLSFALHRPPVLPGAEIYVRESDRPSADELELLQQELRRDDPEAEALLSKTGPARGEGVWVRWHQVMDFLGSGPASRHFTLDPISGVLCFGDGLHGMIPPVGRDNIKAARYRTHDGDKGNAAQSTITVLRNPTGELENIDRVTNLESAAGGARAETLAEVGRRGPQILKHRNRAVTVEDYEWIAREASSEIAIARCLPVRDQRGLTTPGWVTLVVAPKSEDARPTPGPALLRVVRDYIQQRAPVNLQHADHIHVIGPEYIEVSVAVEVIPTKPEKSDQTELAVLARLAAFFHPLRGGPRAVGWELGRDVYLSEVYSELESVSGVDYARNLRLRASLQQFYFRFPNPIQLPFDVRKGAQVSSFDERIKWVLATSMPASADDQSGVRSFGVYGFKAGDSVEILAKDGAIVQKNLRISAISGDRISFENPFNPPSNWSDCDALASLDRRIRLLINERDAAPGADNKVSSVTWLGFQAGDEVCIVSGGRRDSRLEFLEIEQVDPCTDRVFMPEGHLAFSGTHDIGMRVE